MTEKLSDESFECPICRECGPMETTALACDHAFCNKCWGTYIEGKVKEGITVISCPHYKCEEKLTRETLIKLGDASTYEMYKVRSNACSKLVLETSYSIRC